MFKAISSDSAGHLLGTNEGARDHQGVDTDHAAYVDEDNVPHPGGANKAG